MSDALLFFGRTGSAYTKRMLRALKKNFKELDCVAYVFGRPTRDFRDFLERHPPDKVIWDFELDAKRPETPDNGFLTAFENRFGSLRKCLVADRKLTKNGLATVFNDPSPVASDETLRGHCEVRARRLQSLFEKREFAFAFGQQIMYLGGIICVHLCEAFNIPFFRVGHTRVSDRYTLHTGPYEYSAALWDVVSEAVDAGESFPTWDAAEEFERRVQEGGDLYEVPLPPNYQSDTRSQSERITYLWNLIKSERGGITTDYYAETPNLRILIEQGKKLMRKRILPLSDVFESFDASKRYVYFPLQTQPELSLMIWARYCKELDSVARNVAQSLPVDTVLYVNEHPNNWGVRSLDYYRRLAHAPNLLPLDRTIDTRKIIASAEAVTCVTASVGLESLILGTPVLSFGTAGRAPMYANLDTVRTTTPTEGLYDDVVATMNDTVDEREVTAYVAACLDHGIPRDHPEFPRKVCEQIAAGIGR